MRKNFLYRAAVAIILFLLVHAISPLGAHINQPGLIYWHGDTSEKKVALTFDDGPNEPYTSEILQVLRDNNVRATFFVTGKNVETFPETAREIVREGHAIGNHSYSHKDLVLDTNSQVRQEIVKTSDIIEQVTGQRTNLFRPPYGDKDFLTLHQVQKLGYLMVEWTVSAQDWRRPGVSRIVRRVVQGVEPGAIVLMHDGDKLRRGDRSQTVAALPTVIRELRRQGYEFVTIPELLKLPKDSTVL